MSFARAHAALLELDLHVDAGRQVELAEGVDRLLRRLEDVEQALVVRLQADADLVVHARGYSKILVTTPAPTVRPPSRMAKRSPSSIAIGVMRSIFSCTLSPGITISVPSGSVHTPVTSVVRK